MDDSGPPPLWAQLSDLKASISSMQAKLETLQASDGKHIDRFHAINNNLQVISTQLTLLAEPMPMIKAAMTDYNNMKQKGMGVILAASAAGAVTVELLRWVLGRH